VFKFFLKLSMR